MLLEIDKLLYAVAFCETIREALAVFMDAPHDIIRHTHIKSAVAVFREDIDIEGPHERGNTLLDTRNGPVPAKAGIRA